MQRLCIVVVFSALVLGVGIKHEVLGQEAPEDTNIEEALSGFDDDDSGTLDEDVLSGFGDDDGFEVSSEDSESENTDVSWSNIFGSAGLSVSYSYAREKPTDASKADWSGLTKMRPYLSLTWDAKLGDHWKTRISGKAFHDYAYSMKTRQAFSAEVLAELEQEAEMREVYLEGSPFGTLDVKLGNQIVAWGVANSLRVVDVLNPTDNREFGMTDLEDIRLPATMTRLDYYIDDLKLEAVAVHQIKFNKIAPYGSDFNPSSLKSTEVIPESNAENTEFGLAVIGTFNGWDGSLHWAQYFDDTAHTSKMTQSVSGKKIEQSHSRLTMFGATLSVPSGSYLWKIEAATLHGMEFLNVTDKKFARTDVLLGAEYSGWNDTQLVLESGVQHLNDFDKKLEASPDLQLETKLASTISFVQDYLNQTVHLNLVGMMIGKHGEEGGINRASLEYDVMDAFSVTGGVMVYQSGGNAFFKYINENDRIYFETKYSF